MADNVKEDSAEDKDKNNQKPKLEQVAHTHKKLGWVLGFATLLVLVLALVGGAIMVRSTRRGMTRLQVTQTNRGMNMQGIKGRRMGGLRMGTNNQNIAQGKVTAVNDKKFTVDSSGTSLDVQITSDTRFPLNSATTVKVGDQVTVFGEKDSNGVIQAVRIIVN